jgi:hypothetical protein
MAINMKIVEDRIVNMYKCSKKDPKEYMKLQTLIFNLVSSDYSFNRPKKPHKKYSDFLEFVTTNLNTLIPEEDITLYPESYYQHNRRCQHFIDIITKNSTTFALIYILMLRYYIIIRCLGYDEDSHKNIIRFLTFLFQYPDRITKNMYTIYNTKDQVEAIVKKFGKTKNDMLLEYSNDSVISKLLSHSIIGSKIIYKLL